MLDINQRLFLQILKKIIANPKSHSQKQKKKDNFRYLSFSVKYLIAHTMHCFQ